MPIRRLWPVTRHAAQDWWEDNGLRLAASLAYETARSLAPLVRLIVGLVGPVRGQAPVARHRAAPLEGLMGPAGRELVPSMLTTTSPRGGTRATVVGLVTRLIGATAVCGERPATRHLIGEVQPAPTGGVWAGRWALRTERLVALALVWARACLLRVARVISAARAGAAAWFHGPEQALVSRLLALAVSRLVLTLGFALRCTSVPDAEIRGRDV
jgi:membrane protein